MPFYMTVGTAWDQAEVGTLFVLSTMFDLSVAEMNFCIQQYLLIHPIQQTWP